MSRYHVAEVVYIQILLCREFLFQSVRLLEVLQRLLFIAQRVAVKRTKRHQVIHLMRDVHLHAGNLLQQLGCLVVLFGINQDMHILIQRLCLFLLLSKHTCRRQQK